MNENVGGLSKDNVYCQERKVALTAKFPLKKTKKLYIENMQHVYLCTNLNKENAKIPFEIIYIDDF